MDERQALPATEKPARCPTASIEHLPGADQALRWLIKALQKELESIPGEPTEAAKKFGADLKDADKEYLSIGTAVAKYEKFYALIDCQLIARKEWQKKIHAWCEDNVDEPTRAAIADLRQNEYDKPEHELCCKSLTLSDQLASSSACLAQSARKEEEAKQNYDLTIALEKTLTDRFAELETLFKLATAKFEAGKFKAVCAVSLEFDEVYRELSAIHTWSYRRAACGSGNPQLGDPKKEWTPEKFRAALNNRLRRLILAKYQRFTDHQLQLTTQADIQKYSKACEEFGTTRRDEFIRDADDVVPAPQ